MRISWIRAQAAPVVIANATTSVSVNSGEADNGLVPFGGFFDYTDIAAGATPTWSIDPVLRFGNGTTAVLSNGAAGGFGVLSADGSNFVGGPGDLGLALAFSLSGETPMEG